MSLPPVPPRPYDYDAAAPAPPPLPPHPPEIRYHPYEVGINASTPLPAPRAHQVTSAAADLDAMSRIMSPPAMSPSINYNPGFALPYPGSPSPPSHVDVSHSIAAIGRTPPTFSAFGRPPLPPTPPQTSLTAPIPTIPSLDSAMGTVQLPSHDPALRIAWCRDVLYLVDRHTHAAPNEPVVGPVTITDPNLSRLVQYAIPIILSLASTQPPQAEALYLRATLAASGAFPDQLSHNPRAAFRDFESAARAGFHKAWFRLGRDYESFNDLTHARDCFERGVKFGVEAAIYRMGMAHLLGQLGLPASPQTALPLLQRAATLSSLETPQPAYVYALLLLNEFNLVSVPPALLQPLIPAGSSAPLEARTHLERSAYLHFPPAQYKLAHAYEFAQYPWQFDALQSVEWYSKASQAGEVEADMALSKWFLCGSEGAFEKDEGLAWVFAERAANQGLPSAEFAMGYYAEVGVGGPIDVVKAIDWYRKADSHGNTDARDRLDALTQSRPVPLSRQEHDVITESKLVRTRTQARLKSEAQPQGARRGAASGNPNVVEVIRKNTLIDMPQSAPHRDSISMPPPNSHPMHAPARGQPQQMPGRNRYSLADPGFNSAPPSTSSSPSPSLKPPRTESPVGMGRRTASPATGRIPSGVATTPQPPAQDKPKPPGPTTFAEMGFQGAKAEDKECVIM
ncbi:HCP-like protein [Armillaria gallica]|uniref:HCP-like protein n=1 Tax=Armillaria gallica TaxID=47427 RepID=A0A2H3DI26_ARMGA|nr:HCP-like protein [Armillaria gallica]